MTAKFGELTGKLTLTVGNQSVDLGDVRVPITGYTVGYRIRLDSIDASLAAAEQSVRDQMVTLSQAMTTVAEALVTTGPWPPDTGTVDASVWVSPDARVFRLTKQGA